MNFVSGNDTAEAKIQGLPRPEDGRDAFKRLVEHYQGVGIHAMDIREADEVIKSLFYAGECHHNCGGPSLKTTHTSLQCIREKRGLDCSFRFHEDSHTY